MPRSWLDLAGPRFSQAVKSLIEQAGHGLSSDALGDEDTQCQHLFTTIFQGLRVQQPILTQYLIADSTVQDLIVVFRYYRSKRQRKHRDKRIQFVEKRTGADFALTLSVSLKNIAETQRHVLAQVKLIEQRGTIRLDSSQLAKLDEAAGGELGLYAVWGEGTLPSVATVANLKAVLRASGATNSVKASSLLRFSRPLSEYITDEFLGLWHGADFYSRQYKETPGPESIPVLFHFLHMARLPQTQLILVYLRRPLRVYNQDSMFKGWTFLDKKRSHDFDSRMTVIHDQFMRFLGRF